MASYEGFACPEGRFRSQLEKGWNIELHRRFYGEVQYVDALDHDFLVDGIPVEIKPGEDGLVMQAVQRMRCQFLVIVADSPGNFEQWWVASSDYVYVHIERFLRPSRHKGFLREWILNCGFTYCDTDHCYIRDPERAEANRIAYLGFDENNEACSFFNDTPPRREVPRER